MTTAAELRERFLEWKDQGNNIRETDDPELIAGCYIDWASGDVVYALETLHTYASDQYVDRPNFAGAREACEILKGFLDS